MNTSKGIWNQMEFPKAQDNGEREGCEDHEQSTWVNYAKGLMKSFKFGSLWRKSCMSAISIKQTTPKVSVLKKQQSFILVPVGHLVVGLSVLGLSEKLCFKLWVQLGLDFKANWSQDFSTCASSRSNSDRDNSYPEICLSMAMTELKCQAISSFCLHYIC